MKLTATYHNGARYDIMSGKHRVVTDQSADDGRQDAGMSPVELLVGSVASCVGCVVGEFCERHDIPRDGLSVDAEWTMAERPHRVGRIDIAIYLPHRCTPELKDRLLKAAYGCTVHQSLAAALPVSVRLNPHAHRAACSS